MFMFYPSFPYAEQCKFDTCRVVSIFICTCKVLCVLHSCDLCFAHTHCVVFISHAESCELIIAHAESCVFFNVHMQIRVSLLLLTHSPVYSLLSHAESYVLFMFTCRVL